MNFDVNVNGERTPHTEAFEETQSERDEGVLIGLAPTTMVF